MGDETLGLRERKKRQTENAIELAAVRLARELGHKKVTVAAVCEMADISRSTFFNYMPSREAAIFGKPLSLVGPVEASNIMHDRPADPIALRTFRVVLASLDHTRVNPEVAEGRQQLLVEQPETRSMILTPFSSLVSDLSGFLTQWLTDHPSGRTQPHYSLQREAIVTTLLTVSALQVVLTEVQGPSDIVLSEDLFVEALGSFRDIATLNH